MCLTSKSGRGFFVSFPASSYGASKMILACCWIMAPFLDCLHISSYCCEPYSLLPSVLCTFHVCFFCSFSIILIIFIISFSMVYVFQPLLFPLSPHLFLPNLSPFFFPLFCIFSISRVIPASLFSTAFCCAHSMFASFDLFRSFSSSSWFLPPWFQVASDEEMNYWEECCEKQIGKLKEEKANHMSYEQISGSEICDSELSDFWVVPNWEDYFNIMSYETMRIAGIVCIVGVDGMIICISRKIFWLYKIFVDAATSTPTI